MTTDDTPEHAAAADTRLTITVWDAPDAQPRRFTLYCDPPGGDHPDPRRACAALTRAEAPFAPVPPEVRCLAMWSGPQRARIEGSWRGVPVAASYSRTDSCETARWNALADVFGAP